MGGYHTITTKVQKTEDLYQFVARNFLSIQPKSVLGHTFDGVKFDPPLDKKGIREFEDDIDNYYYSFPNAPNLRIITAISSTKYERRNFKSNIVFIPENTSIAENPKIVYNNIKYTFEHKNIRAIRKILESIDEDHVLVFKYCDGNYISYGMDELKVYESKPVYIAKITNYLEWVISLGSCDMMGYKNGEYVSCSQILQDSSEKASFLIDGIAEFIDTTAKTTWESIADTIVKGHGVSFVIFQNNDQNDEIASNQNKSITNEVERFKKSNRCIQPDDVIDFNDENLSNYLSQITKIDGGLIFDSYGKCYAYGVIFDGDIPNEKQKKITQKDYDGNNERGSRYNSMKLYIYNMCIMKNISCIGVVYSDDGSVDIIGNTDLLYPPYF